MIGRLPYLYFLLLEILTNDVGVGLEDCRTYTSFYFPLKTLIVELIGRLPYYYFLLLPDLPPNSWIDWKTAVFILPFT